MRVGILTLPFELNYGWAVQMWALYVTLKKLGYEPVIINRRWSHPNNNFVRELQRFAYYNILCHRYKQFIEVEMPNFTPIVRNSDAIKQVTLDLDAVIVGSDQVWRIENTKLADLNFFLDFLDGSDKIRIAYAASFGNSLWKGTSSETLRIKELLQRFRAISVREDTGVSLCKNIFNQDAIQVLDPTLLLESSEYDSILRPTKKTNNLVTYILDFSKEYGFLLNSLSKTRRLKWINLFPKHKYSYYKSVYVWLQEIRDARYVIVDSFHGMLLSIIFSKQFVVLANEKRGLDRFTSLLKIVGLENRLLMSFDINEINSLFDIAIDYKSVHKKLATKRVESIAFLTTNLSI